MNDFTEEELCLIVDGLTLLSYQNNDRGDSIILRAKAISMIDSYCEHEWRKGVHLFNDIYCTKCPRTLNDNQEK